MNQQTFARRLIFDSANLSTTTRLSPPRSFELSILALTAAWVVGVFCGLLLRWLV